VLVSLIAAIAILIAASQLLQRDGRGRIHAA
jgi:hypothetical protein